MGVGWTPARRRGGHAAARAVPAFLSAHAPAYRFRRRHFSQTRTVRCGFHIPNIPQRSCPYMPGIQHAIPLCLPPLLTACRTHTCAYTPPTAGNGGGRRLNMRLWFWFARARRFALRCLLARNAWRAAARCTRAGARCARAGVFLCVDGRRWMSGSMRATTYPFPLPRTHSSYHSNSTYHVLYPILCLPYILLLLAMSGHWFARTLQACTCLTSSQLHMPVC